MAGQTAGFETNDLSEMDGSSTGGSNTVAASSEQANSGSYSCKIEFDGDDSAYVYWTETDTEFWGRMYIYIPSAMTVAQWASMYIVRIMDGSLSGDIFSIRIQRYSAGDGSWERWTVAGDQIAGGNSETNFSLDAWHRVEWHWTAGTGSDGGAEVRIDGDEIYSDLDEDLSTTTVGQHRMGSAQATVTPDTGDEIYIDDLGYDDADWLGAVGASQSPVPLIMQMVGG